MKGRMRWVGAILVLLGLVVWFGWPSPAPPPSRAVLPPAAAEKREAREARPPPVHPPSSPPATAPATAPARPAPPPAAGFPPDELPYPADDEGVRAALEVDPEATAACAAFGEPLAGPLRLRGAILRETTDSPVGLPQEVRVVGVEGDAALTVQHCLTGILQRSTFEPPPGGEVRFDVEVPLDP